MTLLATALKYSTLADSMGEMRESLERVGVEGVEEGEEVVTRISFCTIEWEPGEEMTPRWRLTAPSHWSQI